MGNKKGIKESRLIRFVKAPFRFLGKARDMYVQGMNHCNAHFPYFDAGIGCPSPAVRPAALPRSFSVGSAPSSTTTDDYRELVRAASVKTYRNGVMLDHLPRKPPSEMTVPRSHSVGIGRIDEDKPCDFEDDAMAKPRVYNRSRSQAVRRSAGLF